MKVKLKIPAGNVRAWHPEFTVEIEVPDDFDGHDDLEYYIAFDDFEEVWNVVAEEAECRLQVTDWDGDWEVIR